MAKTSTTPEADPATTGLPADEYKREQEKGGKDPVSKAVEAKKAETVEIAPNEPYPTGGGSAEQGRPHNEVKPEE